MEQQIDELEKYLITTRLLVLLKILKKKEENV